jgi:N-acetylglucosamine malate deacetylase 1
MSKSILVLAAHPDDELLGCGGTLARHAEAGEKVHICILAEGATSRDVNSVSKQDEVMVLQMAAVKAAEIIGAQPPRFAGLPDNRMDQVNLLDVVQIVEAQIAETAPDVIYTHHGGDLNVDHRITHAAALTAARPLPGQKAPDIFTFETLSSTEWSSAEQTPQFQPMRFVDISSQLPTKLQALNCYPSEIRAFPHPRSPEAVEALARYRGASAGVAAAEAFQVIRQVR